MLSGKFLNVAVQVLWREAVKRAFVRPFQGTPEALYSVCVRHVPNVLTDRVTDALMPAGNAVIGQRVIGIDNRIGVRVCSEQTLAALPNRCALPPSPEPDYWPGL